MLAQQGDRPATARRRRDGQVERRASPNARWQRRWSPRSRLGLVEVGDHDRAGHPDGGALPPQQPVAPSISSAAETTKMRRVGGAQPGAQLADEVGDAGGVEQVDGQRLALERRHREADRAVGARPLASATRDAGRDGCRTGWTCRLRRDRRGRRCGCPRGSGAGAQGMTRFSQRLCSLPHPVKHLLRAQGQRAPTMTDVREGSAAGRARR